MEVFTTILLQNGKPLYWVEHMERLRRHANVAGLPHPPRDARHPLPPEGEGLLRIAIREGSYRVTTRPVPPRPQGPVKIILSSQIATSRIKTNQREVYDRAMIEARKAGAFEALLCNSEGYVVDGTRSSPFLIQGPRVISLLGGIDGITRLKHLEHLAARGFEICEAYLRPHELQGELWIAGTGAGVLNTNWA